MKLYTDKIQTAKLIELGFEKPKGLADAEPSSGKWVRPAYSIGELIEMLPRIILPLHCRKIIGVSVEYSFDDPFGSTPPLYLICQGSELIDNLYDAVVKLKEEGVI